MEKNFIKVRSIKDIIIASSLIVAGIVCIIIPTGVSINILGALLIAGGILLAVILKSAYKDMETGKVFRKIERFFPQSQKENFLRALADGLENIDLKEENKGNGLRVDTYFDGKDQVFVQLYEYIPYKYEVCSPYFEFKAVLAAKLIA